MAKFRKTYSACVASVPPKQSRRGTLKLNLLPLLFKYELSLLEEDLSIPHKVEMKGKCLLWGISDIMLQLHPTGKLEWFCINDEQIMLILWSTYI